MKPDCTAPAKRMFAERIQYQTCLFSHQPFRSKIIRNSRCQLDSAAYLIMPTTFEPREEANFSLRIYSKKPLKMKVLDYAPQMLRTALIKAPASVETSSFSQYEAVFLQLADEHRTIDAFELQELLDACLPNDYIKSCASIDTCRQIVLSMDVSLPMTYFR